jgi:hypothetical protein
MSRTLAEIDRDIAAARRYELECRDGDGWGLWSLWHRHVDRLLDERLTVTASEQECPDLGG